MVTYFYLIIFITSVFVLINNTSYLYFIVVLELLSLETLFVIYFYSCMVSSFGNFLIIITMVTAEAALGLTLVVTVVRTNGSDGVSARGSSI